MRLADIFFDFQPVIGDVRLAQQLRGHIRALAMQNPKLLQSMLLAHEEHGVGLGLFGGFITMGSDSEFRGHINVKNTGLLPLISALRLLALKHGVTATGTVERIEALRVMGVMDSEEFREVKTSSDFLADLILRHQLEGLKRGETPNYYIHPDSLDRARAAGLKRALTTIRRLRDRVRADLTGDVL
jgi:signal-transduction protein with cAMP-binding, CBS, and nucleotidyltransferase domain